MSKDPTERQPSIRAFAAALTSDSPAPGRTSATPALPVDAYGGTLAVSTGDAQRDASAPAPSLRPTTTRRAVWFAGGAAGSVALALGAWALLASPPAPSAPPVVAQASSQGTTPREQGAGLPEPKPDAPAAREQGAGLPEPTLDAPAAREGAPDASSAAAAAAPARGAKTESGPQELLPASVRATLEQAEAALRAKDFASALRLAQRSLYEAKSPQAYAVMAQAYCGQRDVGMAVAMLRNLRGRDDRRVRAYCAQLGITLAR
jgi:hypothetical protein